MTQKVKKSWIRSNVVKVAGIHFIFVFAYIVQIMIYDAWKLITPQAVLERWIAAATLLVINTFVWYIARGRAVSSNTYKKLVFLLIAADIAMASFNVYTQRGMASRAVVLYVIPIVVSAVLVSRSALLATVSLSIAAYTTTAVSYFVLNFNEGYKIELYGEVTSYCVLFLILAALLWTVVRHQHSE